MQNYIFVEMIITLIRAPSFHNDIRAYMGKQSNKKNCHRTNDICFHCVLEWRN